MAWLPGFQRVVYAHTPGLGTSPAPNRGIVFHTTEGSTWTGADATYQKITGTPHFTVDPWRSMKVQHIDTELGAYALQNLAGGVETNTYDVVQIEIVGFTSWKRAVELGYESFHISNLPTWAYRWLGEEVVAPIMKAHPTIPNAVYGGASRMTFAQWESWEGGLCGHKDVPENTHTDPGDLNLSTVLSYARGALYPAVLPQEDDMTKQEYADAIGAVIPTDGPFAGKVCVPLVNDDLKTFTLYQLADALTFTHQELKIKRLQG